MRNDEYFFFFVFSFTTLHAITAHQLEAGWALFENTCRRVDIELLTLPHAGVPEINCSSAGTSVEAEETAKTGAWRKQRKRSVRRGRAVEKASK